MLVLTSDPLVAIMLPMMLGAVTLADTPCVDFKIRSPRGPVLVMARPMICWV